MDPNRILHSSQSSSALAGAAVAAGLGFGRIQWDDDGDLHRYDTQRNDAVGGPEPPREEWREPMFEKPLTPSDVGKLNRLVIPKQHAEKHFPLGGGSGAGAEKEVLLSFEDESGKPWRFRYSYWNSSQSYVLTKGWSRFVKEKRLDAGDVVLFEKHRRDGRRLFIGWRRCAERRAQDSEMLARFSPGGPSGGGAWTTAGAFYSAHPYPPNPPAPYHHHNRLLDHSLHAGPAIQVQTTPSVGSPKRLRLFGVNLECQPDGSEPSLHHGSSGLSHGSVHEPFFTQIPNPPSHMDMNFSRDGN